MALELWFPPQSREFGWGMDITEEQMVSINEMRMGKEYFDTVATKDVNGIEQKLLTTSLFICLFEFGGINGYWTGNHMIFQTEDYIDCLEETIMDKCYEIGFLFIIALDM